MKRFRPPYRVAFHAWIATCLDANPNAPPGPQYMPEYKQPLLAPSHQLDAKADAYFADRAVEASVLVAPFRRSKVRAVPTRRP